MGGSGLQHVRTGTALVAGSRRAQLVARGRRELAVAPHDAHYRQALEAYSSGRLAEAATAFRAAAEDGHAESQYMLSIMLEDGEGIPPDTHESALWERRAAEQGHSYAQANVSYRFYVEGDFVPSLEWCVRAADSGLAWAQYNAGLMLRKGEGTPRDDAAAAQYYRKAAEQDHSEAQAKLAELYALGRGVSQSHREAASWYRRAAEAGNAEAQYQLGLLFALGQGVEHDYVRSRFWMRAAAQQGHPQARDEWKAREYRDA